MLTVVDEKTPVVRPKLLDVEAEILDCFEALIASVLRSEDDSASRACYAAFHRNSALYLSRSCTFPSHGQPIGRFNTDSVKDGFFPKASSKFWAAFSRTDRMEITILSVPGKRETAVGTCSVLGRW
jgi:hypothetical protein